MNLLASARIVLKALVEDGGLNGVKVRLKKVFRGDRPKKHGSSR